jgi:hypothetical protein
MRRPASVSAVLALALAGLPAGRAHAQSFGTHCQSRFDDRNLGDLPNAFEVCGRFNGTFDNEVPLKFYYDLSHKAHYWHEGGDQDPLSLEDVDLFFTMTHGGVATDDAIFAMKEQGSFAYTSQMRLGDEGVGLSIFAAAACHILKIDDRTWARWDSVFKGGLRMALGSHDMFWWKADENNVGRHFAVNLQRGHTFKSAWSQAFSGTPQPEDPAIMVASGPGVDCDHRRDQMSWDNFASFERLRDGSADGWCGWFWVDL